MEKKKIILLCILCLIVGIVIFFLPNMITIIFERTGLDNNEYSCMYDCVLDINKCEYKK